MSVDRGSFSGNIGRVDEVRYVGQEAAAVLSFSVAISTGKNDPAKWVKCSVWRKRAEALSSILAKGMPVTVWFRDMKCRAWLKDGEAAAALECTVEDIALHGKKEGADRSAHAGRAPDVAPAYGTHDHGNADYSDIPF